MRSQMDVPKGIRRSVDGRYWSPCVTQKQLAWLRENCVCSDGTHWYPKAYGDCSIDDLREHFYSKRVYIVGKGPSLDHVDNYYFDPDCPIIAINHAVHQIAALKLPNKLFCLQQDSHLRDVCKVSCVPMMCSPWSRHWYFDHHPVYVYDITKLDCTPHSLSAVVAISIAKQLGSSCLTLVCFDACVTGETDYATCVGHKSKEGGDPKRFLTHRELLIKRAGTMEIEWVIPTSPECRD